MKLIRWLLSHSFLILLIVVVIYGYMFWGNLLGKDTPAGKAVAYLSSEFVAVEEFVNAVKAKQARLNGETPAEQASAQPVIAESAQADEDETGNNAQQAIPVKTGSVQRSEAADHAARQPEKQGKLQAINDTSAHTQVYPDAVVVDVPETGTENQFAQTGGRTNSQAGSQAGSATGAPQQADTRVTAEQATAQSNADLNKAGVGSIAKNSMVDNSMADSDMTDSSSEQIFVSPEIEKQLENVDKLGRVIDTSQESETIKANWITARKSFYQRNYTLSEKSYQRVIDNTEDNFDAYGELGNVYFNQGKNQQAASAYFEAAAILVRKGQVSRARSLMGLLRHLDKSKAGELQQLIDSVVS